MSKIIDVGKELIAGSGNLIVGATEGLISVLGFAYDLYKLVRNGPEKQVFEDRKQMANGADTPRQFVYGHVRIGGQLVYWEPTGADSRYMHMIVVLAPHGMNQINEIYFNDTLAFDASGVAQGDFAGKATVVKVAEPRATALPEAVAALEEWTESHILIDHSYLYIRLDYDKDAFSRGMPSVSTVVQGKNDIYDPRTDSFGYTRNHALIVLDQILNKNGFNCIDTEYGTQSFIDGANICDEQVPASTGTENRYTLDCVLSFSNTPQSNVSSLLSAGAAGLSFDQGVFQYIAGKYVAPIVDYDESDLVGGLVFTTGLSKAQVANVAKGSFLDARQNFDKVQYKPIEITKYSAADGEELVLELNAPMTTSPTQARRMGKLAIEHSRFGVRLQASFKFKALQLIEGDRITLSIARLGWDKKVFRVLAGGYSISLTEGITMSLAEDAPEVWDWTEGEALDIPQAPSMILPDSGLNAPTNLSISESLYTTTNTSDTKTRAIFSWVSGGVRSAMFAAQYRPEGGDWETVSTDWRDDQITINDIQLGRHEFRVQGVTDLGRTSDWAVLVYTVIGKDSPPNNVSAINAAQKSYGLDVAWQPVTDLDVRLYELRLDDDFGQTGAIYSGSQSSFADIRRQSGITYYVRALDTSGNYSDMSAQVTPSITGPSAVPSINPNSINSNVQLQWGISDSVYPIATYEIRKGETYAASEFIGEVGGTFMPIQESQGGTYRYWVTPTDAAGQKGESRSAIAVADDPQDFFLRADSYLDLTAMDTLTDIAVGFGGGLKWSDTQLPWSDEALRWDEQPSADLIGPVNNTESFLDNMIRSGLTTDPTQVWSETTQAWNDTGEAWDNIGGDPYGQKELNGFTHWLDPSVANGIAEEVVDFEAVIASTRITLTIDYENMVAGATLTATISTSLDGIAWTEFAPNQLEVSASNFQYMRINIEIDAPNSTGLIKINSVRYRLDVKQKTDQGVANVLASDTSGTVVVFNKPFIDIDSITATPKAIDKKIAVVDYEDIGNQDRCTIYAYDIVTGARVDATVNWIVRGS